MLWNDYTIAIHKIQPSFFEVNFPEMNFSDFPRVSGRVPSSASVRRTRLLPSGKENAAGA